ncbi:hypothetical protein [Tsukamurella soli]
MPRRLLPDLERILPRRRSAAVAVAVAGVGGIALPGWSARWPPR